MQRIQFGRFLSGTFGSQDVRDLETEENNSSIVFPTANPIGNRNSWRRDTQLTIPLGEIVKQGMLEKKSNSRTLGASNWQERWWVLKTGYLYYFKHKKVSRFFLFTDFGGHKTKGNCGFNQRGTWIMHRKTFLFHYLL